MMDAKPYTDEEIAEICEALSYFGAHHVESRADRWLATVDALHAEIERWEKRWSDLNEVADTDAVHPGWWGKAAARAIWQRNEALDEVERLRAVVDAAEAKAEQYERVLLRIRDTPGLPLSVVYEIDAALDAGKEG